LDSAHITPAAAIGDVAELFDVDVQHCARVVVFVSPDRFICGAVDVGQPVEAAPGEYGVHMRSAPYAAAWRPDGPTVAVRVVRERILGGVVERSVVSHMAKATRGMIARDLITTGAAAESPSQLAKVLSELGHVVEMQEPTRADGTWTAGIILREYTEGSDPRGPTRSAQDSPPQGVAGRVRIR
jgi:hypothetical protein